MPVHGAEGCSIDDLLGLEYHIKQPWRNQLKSLPWTVFRGARLSRAVFRGHGEVVRVCFTEARRELSMALAFAAADVLLPNARGEAEALGRDLGVATPCHMVPNGVSTGVFHTRRGAASTPAVACCTSAASNLTRTSWNSSKRWTAPRSI